MKYRKNVWRKAAVLAAVIIGSLSVTSCKFGETEVVLTSSMSENEVFRINDKSCSLAEAKVFLTNYQNIYATVYGVDLWEHDFGDNSLEEYVKNLTISQLAQIVSMDFLAQSQKVSLSKDELEKISSAAEKYYDSLSKEEISYMGVSEGTIEEMYQQYGLANKVYAHLTTGVNDEVSDDEARVMMAMQIFVTDEARAQEVAGKLTDGGDFASLAGTYNEAGEIEITFGRGKMPKEVEDVAFSMENDQVSGPIKTTDGIYFLKCMDKYNQELTDANKDVIVENRRKEAFDDVYEEFVKTLSSRFNDDVWDGIHVELNEEITTKSFFETYEDYCKW